MEIALKHNEKICEGGQVPEQGSQRACRICMLRDIQNPSPGQPALADLA